MINCNNNSDVWESKVYETSAAGNSMKQLETFEKATKSVRVSLNPEVTYQTITGIGGSFTESSAYLLNRLGDVNRKKVINAYFGDDGAKYSLTRTHINSCDFSLSNYSYAPTPGDKDLADFSIKEDEDDLIPMIKDAMAVSSEGFKIISSPWTAPPWMKDNKKWVGGKLLPEYYDSWSLFFSKYIDAYKSEGIDIWGVTVENEPLGNGNNWESMHYSADEMTAFVNDHLGPSLESNGHSHIKILGYDQNRDHLKEWVDVMYKDEKSSKYMDGTAIHWYASTYEVFPEVLQYAHDKAPDKYLIETEGCIDAEVPHWKEDDWYWKKEATDWGWDWAPEEDKHFHPKYVPVYRYARDIIGCLNNWVDGWIDWNMVLDRQGGPNWFKNWCLAPIIVDPDMDEVYITPLYYAMAHFSKFIRPGSKRIDFSISNDDIQLTSVENPDGSIVLVILNQNEYPLSIDLNMGLHNQKTTIRAQSIQTVVLNKTK
ncbi:MAG: glucosylceramidase [Halioglobus sp.]|jgi:glucosylceramidase